MSCHVKALLSEHKPEVDHNRPCIRAFFLSSRYGEVDPSPGEEKPLVKHQGIPSGYVKIA